MINIYKQIQQSDFHTLPFTCTWNKAINNSSDASRARFDNYSTEKVGSQDKIQKIVLDANMMTIYLSILVQRGGCYSR